MTEGLSADQCRDTIARILTEERAALRELGPLLDREHGCLVANDLEGLEAASAQRQDCIARMIKLGDERRALCRMLGRPADLAGLSALVAWCDPEGTLGPLLREHAELSAACRDRNQRNGALVGARMARISSMLGMLNGEAASPTVYERTGVRSAALPHAGRLVAARA